MTEPNLDDEPEWLQDDLDDIMHPRDSRKGPFVCGVCGDGHDWGTYKSLRVHQKGSHTQETCRICGDSVGIRGLTSHETMCAEVRSGRLDEMLPTSALRARLRDFLERAREAPQRDDVYCVTCEEGDPAFVRDVGLCEWVRGRGMCWMFPAKKISPELFVAPPRRDRRTGAHVKEQIPKTGHGPRIT